MSIQSKSILRKSDIENDADTTDLGTNPKACAEEIHRLQQDYQQRIAADRPLSHSVATAYKQLMARCKADQSPESPTQ